MLELRWRKPWRDAWWQRGRLLLVGLSITLALTAAGAVLHTWALLSQVTQDGYAASLPVDATLTVAGVTPEQLAALRADGTIAAVAQRSLLTVRVDSGAGWRAGLLFVPDRFADRPLQRLSAVSGEWPPPRGSVAVEASALDYSGAVVGQPLRLMVGERTAELPVSGSVRDVSLAPGWMEHQVYLYADPSTLQGLGLTTGFDQLQLRWRDLALDRAAIRTRAVRIARRLEADGLTVQRLEVPARGRHIHAAQMESLLLVQGAFAVLALLACVPLVMNLLEVLLARQVRELAVMQTLGASPTLLRRPLLWLTALLGLVCAGVAVPAAIAVARPYAAMKAEMLNFPLDGIGVPDWSLLVQLGVSVLLPLVAAWLPVRRACAQPIAATLRGADLPSAGSSADRAVRRFALPGPLRLALAQVRRRGRRSLWTVLALALGGAVYLGAAQLGRGVRGAVDLQFASQLHDFQLRVAEAQPLQALEASALAVPGIAQAEAWLGWPVRLDEEPWSVERRFTVTGLPPGTPLLRARVLKGRWLAATDGRALVISRRLQQENPELVIGHRVRLRDRTASVREWQIVGVVDAGPALAVWAPRDTIAALGDGRSTVVRLRLERPLGSQIAQLETLRRVRETYEAAGWSPGESQRPDASRQVYEDHLLMVVQFLAAIGWVMLAVGALGLASTLGLGVLERTREIGVLRVLGAGRGPLQWLLHGESLVLSMLAFVLALPLSIPMGLVLAAGFGRVFFTVPIEPWPVLSACGIWLLWSLLVGMLAGAFAARRALQVRPAEALAWI